MLPSPKTLYNRRIKAATAMRMAATELKIYPECFPDLRHIEPEWLYGKARELESFAYRDLESAREAKRSRSTSP